jgi:hypothetical protein
MQKKHSSHHPTFDYDNPTCFRFHSVPGTPRPALPLPMTAVTNIVIVTQNVDQMSFGD